MSVVRELLVVTKFHTAGSVYELDAALLARPFCALLDFFPATLPETARRRSRTCFDPASWNVWSLFFSMGWIAVMFLSWMRRISIAGG
jgi:hypothetical protein